MEFCPGRLLLQFCLLQCLLPGEIFQGLPHFLVLIFDMMQVALPGIEIVLVFATIVTSVVFLDEFGLLIEELALF